MTTSRACQRCRRLPCHCCDDAPTLPLPLGGRPGLDRIPYRLGTHAAFLSALEARLSSLEIEVEDGHGNTHSLRPLAALTARDPSDPSIALLDAWASVAHVLCFYQERILNEGYLRTATELRSLRELARLTGYDPRPGVSAGVDLALTLDPDMETTVPAGSRFQSVPARQDELPQVFETQAPLSARTAWNELPVRRSLPHLELAGGEGTLWLAGVNTLLAPGAPILVKEGQGRRLLRVLQVEPDFQAERTAVEVEPWFEGRRVVRHAATADLRALADELRREFGNQANVREILDRLGRIEQLTVDGASPRVVAAEVEATRSDLQARIARARDWVHVRTALERAARVVEKLRARRPELGLAGLDSELPTPPKVGGARATFAETYGEDGDARLKLLIDLTPGLGGELYQAWADVAPGQDATLGWVDALRARAAPIATRAPTRVLSGARGQPVGRAPWPLEVPLELGVRFRPSGPEKRPMLRLTGALGDLFGEHVEPTDGDEFGGETELIPGLLQVRWARDERRRIVATFRGRAFGEDRTREILFAEPGAGPGRLGTFATSGTEVALNALDIVHREVDEGLLQVGAEAGPGEAGATTLEVYAQLEHWRPVQDPRQIVLDAELPNLVPGGFAAVVRPSLWGEARVVVATIREITVVAESRFLQQGRFSRLLLDEAWVPPDARTHLDVRDYQVFLGSERLDTASIRYDAPVCGGELELEGLYPGLAPGRVVVVEGERIDVPGKVRAAERAVIARVRHGPRQIEGRPYPGDRNHTFLVLDRELQHCYARSSLRLLGNVVHATHGETREQVLGSGDAGAALQHFPVAFERITHLPVPSASGAETTLRVRVDEVRWDGVPLLAAAGPRDRVYATRHAGEGGLSVRFGDGIHGARLPTGVDNVSAELRQGLGRAGNVGPGQIKLLMGPVLGVRGSDNPLGATGGADPDGAEGLRARIPLATLALERLVGIPDYASFALGFAGIGKADAVELVDGRRSVVHVTIAGEDDIPLDGSSDLFRALRQALIDHGDPQQAVVLEVRRRLALVVAARLRVLPAYRAEDVLPKVEAALRRHFAFAARAIGQDANLSEAVAAMQGVAGVARVVVDRFDVVDREKLLAAGPVADRLGRRERIPVARARLLRDGKILPGELAYLSRDVAESVLLEEIPS